MDIFKFLGHKNLMQNSWGGTLDWELTSGPSEKQEKFLR